MGLARERWIVGLIVCFVLWPLTSGVQGLAQDRASVALESGQVVPGETIGLDITLVTPRGLQRFDLTIIVANGSIAQISGITIKGINPNFARIVNQNPTAIRVQGVDLDNQITSTDEPIVLMTLSLRGRIEGTTDVSIADAQIFDERGSPYSVATEDATLEVSESAQESPEEPEESPPTEPQPLPGANAPPRDLDGDGLFEDANGDGRFTAADVALFALQWNSDAVQNRPSAFDFNTDGQVNRDDPFALAGLLDASQQESEPPETPSPQSGPGITALALTGGPFRVGETTTVTLRLIGAPSGLQSYRVRLRTGVNLEIIEIRGDSATSGLIQVKRPSDGTLEIQAVDVDDQITSGAQNIALAEIAVRPRQPGDAEIALDVVTFIDDEGRSLDPFVRPLSMSVTPVVSPISDADQPPRDLDGDGLYEDVNGDGAFTQADVILLALNLNSPAVYENVALFDFNGDGSINFADVQALRHRL